MHDWSSDIGNVSQADENRERACFHLNDLNDRLIFQQYFESSFSRMKYVTMDTNFVMLMTSLERVSFLFYTPPLWLGAKIELNKKKQYYKTDHLKFGQSACYFLHLKIQIYSIYVKHFFRRKYMPSVHFIHNLTA